MTDSAPDFIDAMLRSIVGIEVAIETIVGKSKLGQNREDRDRLGAAGNLQKRDQHAIAATMLSAGNGPT